MKTTLTLPEMSQVTGSGPNSWNYQRRAAAVSDGCAAQFNNNQLCFLLQQAQNRCDAATIAFATSILQRRGVL